jgi:hypothetical protein
MKKAKYYRTPHQNSIFTSYTYFGFELLTAVILKNTILWITVPSSSHTDRRFGGIYHVQLQSREKTKQEISRIRRQAVDAVSTHIIATIFRVTII